MCKVSGVLSVVIKKKMAVFTHFSKEDINNILEDYSFLGELETYQEIEEGVSNSNYLIVTNKNKYILTIFEKDETEQDLLFFTKLMNFLSKKNHFFSSEVFQGKNGFLFNYKNKKGIISSFLNGKPIENNIPQRFCSDIAENLAEIHISLQKSFLEKRKNPVDLEKIKNLFFTLEKHIDIKRKNIINNFFDNFLQKVGFSQLEKGIIHYDLFPDNVFFNKEQQISGIIDFYYSCYDYLIFDLAIVIISWCFDENNKFLAENYSVILDGYQKQRKLTKVEKELLPYFCILSLIRFYLVRLKDKINHNKDNLVSAKDPEEMFARIKQIIL